MHPSIPLAVAAASFATARNVVSIDIQRAPVSPEDLRLRRLARRQTIAEPLANNQNLYFANVTVGTPGQALSLQIDTGSSDVWMTSSSADFCQGSSSYYQDPCLGGTFNSDASSTYNYVSADFDISYVDNTGSKGDFFTDNLSIGPSGSLVTITGQQMGLALETTIGTGILGLGFSADESVCSQTFGKCDTYPSVIEMMVSQKKINSKAYSLWLNDLDASTGSVLFGGVDSDKYTGQLVTLPIQPDSQSGTITSFTVAWTNFTLGTSNGAVGGFVDNNFLQPAILDSGTTLTLVPDDLANALNNQFGAEQAGPNSDNYLAPCSLASSTATFDFQFGGASGPTIRVPIGEMLLDAGTDDFGNPIELSSGEAACLVGIQAAGDNPILFGDTFLRSAYVVYDLDNQQVSIAQTDFNATSSNVQEIQAGKGGVPDVASTANGATVSQSAVGFGGFGGLGSLLGIESPTPAPSAARSTLAYSSAGSGAPLAQYTAPNSFSPEPSGGGAASSTGAAGLSMRTPVSVLRHEGLIMGALVAVAAAVGGAVVVL